VGHKLEKSGVAKGRNCAHNVHTDDLESGAENTYAAGDRQADFLYNFVR